MGRTANKYGPAVEMGRRIRATRLGLGLSPESLAERSGLHVSYVASVERGERNVSLRNYPHLAAALDLDPGDLVEGLKV